MITQRGDVNLVPKGIAERIHVSQFDANSRTLIFDLFAYEEINVSGVSAVIEGLKPDGNYFAYNCTISGTHVTAPLNQQMTACAGEVLCTIKLYQTQDIILRTINFILDVDEKPMPSDAVVSQTEIPVIVELGRTYAEESRISAEQANESALAAATSETNAYTSEAYAKQHAEDSEAWAVGKRGGVDVVSGDDTYHNNSKYYSEQASSSATSASNSASTSSSYSSAALTFSMTAESYAKGGTNTRTGEDADNAKYYKETAERIVADLGHPLVMKGKCTFENLPSNVQEGWCYQITNAFTPDNRFVSGDIGIEQKPNTEVYMTSERLWACMGGAGLMGHNILNPNGTKMTDRDDLQFIGNVEVSDENQKTVVNIKGKPDHVYSTKAQMLADVSNIGEGEMAYTTEDAGDLVTRVENIKTDIANIQDDVEDLQDDVTTINSNLTWKSGGRCALGNTENLPSTFNELLFELNDVENDIFTIYVINGTLPSSGNLFLPLSYNTGTHLFNFIVKVSNKSTFNLYQAKKDGSDISGAFVDVKYR